MHAFGVVAAQITRQAAIQLLAEGALVMPRASWETNT
jgi:hypothetical protein